MELKFEHKRNTVFTKTDGTNKLEIEPHTLTNSEIDDVIRYLSGFKNSKSRTADDFDKKIVEHIIQINEERRKDKEQLMIGGGRMVGKTVELIEMSAAKNIPIIVASKEQTRIIKSMAVKLGWDIPDPIYIRALNRKDCESGFEDKVGDVLVDEIEVILRTIFGFNIIASTSSAEFKDKYKEIESIADGIDNVISKINEFKKITESMLDTYERKNVDYGDSFGESFKEFGLISSVVRMNDKMSRLKAFVNNGDYQVKDESVKDTLLDLANYCIMTVIELNNQDQK